MLCSCIAEFTGISAGKVTGVSIFEITSFPGLLYPSPYFRGQRTVCCWGGIEAYVGSFFLGIYTVRGKEDGN